MKYIGKLLGWILLGVNGIVVLLLLLSAYSPYLNPQTFPHLSCAGLFFPIFLLANLLFLCFWLVVYRKYALLPLLAFICCWQAIRIYFPINLFSEAKPEKTIKVLSYNTMAFGERTAHTKEKPNPILKYLADSDADIICLQECVWGGKLKKRDIDYALKDYRYKHHHSLSRGRNGLGCYSKYPILSATPVDYKSKGNGSIAYRIKVGEDTLLVINNHLESFRIENSDVAVYHEMMDAPTKKNLSSGFKQLMKKLALPAAVRAGQADAVAKVIEDFKGQGVIVCGDFNDSPLSYAHRRIGHNLNDAFVESGNGLGISYHEDRLYFRIDHLLLGKALRPYQCTVDRTIQASDHYPIWCHIAIE